MKNSLLAIAILWSAETNAQDKLNSDSLKTIDLKEVIVSSTRATSQTPMTFNELTVEEIEKNNTGRDLPYLLELTPSAVTTSDAGAGVGYTGIRIRGSDAARVNVTLNGIPYNDPESQQVFWVNMPDFASSVSSIQVQRGLGSSTNGAGAFGASVNIETSGLNKEAYASLDNSFGSFNTRKHTFSVGSGLINGKFAFDGRLSKITSNGYVDRATSDLSSYFITGGYYGKKSLVKFNIFSGHETTYQSWYGVPESRINNDVEGMNAYIARNYLSKDEANNLLNSGRTYNQYTYENEVDDYQQTHYQMISSFDLSQYLTLNISLFLVHGEGYFEQYKADEDMIDYQMDTLFIGNDTIASTDLIRRRWLNNNFYGTTFSLDYRPNNKFDLTLGGAWNLYDGDHFGRVIWTQYASNAKIRHQYYFNNSLKTDLNIFLKANYLLTENLNIYGDLQVRKVDYTLNGTDNDGQIINQSHEYYFFNPKVGAKYQLNEFSNLYASFGMGSKEPVRSDFTDNNDGNTPRSEQLQDLEFGYNWIGAKVSFNATFYHMNYKNQLVLTGAVNDVGSPLRINTKKSKRAGIELQIGYQLIENLKLNANATFSRNKINDFNEVIFNWDENQTNSINHKDTDIAFSPNLIAGGSLEYTPIKGWDMRWMHRYVGQQYLDNTSSDNRKLANYYISDFSTSYTLTGKSFKSISIRFTAFNIFNKMYSSNGYTWGYRSDGNEIRENFYYPQAGSNFTVGLNLKL